MATYEGKAALQIPAARGNDFWISGHAELLSGLGDGAAPAWRGSLRSSDVGPGADYRGPADLVITRDDDPTDEGGHSKRTFGRVQVVDVVAGAGTIIWKFFGVGPAPF